MSGSSTSTRGIKSVRRTVGRYEILREIGRGGMATVYLSRQIGLDRDVALKELGALRAEDPSFVKRFLREAQLAGSLSHPNVVTVHDYFEDNGVPYIAMEYVDGGSVRPWVGQMSTAQIGGVLRDVLAGLGAAEKHDIVHRDLKPENLMITSEGRVKIADFGIAKATNKVQTGAFMTSTGIAVGTPNYIAPEQARAQPVGPWTDLYALGVMAFEFFVGKAPFADTEEPMAVLLRHVNDPIPPVRESVPDIDPQLSAWVEWLVSKKAADRPQSAHEAWDAIEAILIDTLGPQWSRWAPLLDASALPPEARRPPAGPVAAAAAVGGAAAAAAGLPASERTTGRLGDSPMANTMAPTPPLTPASADTLRSQPRRGWRPFVIGAVTTVAVIAMIAAALSPSRGGSGAAPADNQTAAVSDLQSKPPPAISNADRATLAKRGRAADRLGRQYEATAAEIESLGSRSGSNAALIDALRQTATAYKRGGTAARNGDETGYTASIARAVSSRNAVQRLLNSPSSGTAESAAPADAGAEDPGGSDEQSDDPSDDEGEGSDEP